MQRAVAATEVVGSSGALSVQAPTVCEAFQRVVAECSDKVALRTLGGHLSLTWSELNQRVAVVAAGLAGIGLGHGDTLAMLLPNVPEWHVLDFAAVHLGAVPFNIFNSSSAEQIAHQLRNSDAKVVVTQHEFLPRVETAMSELDGQVTRVIVLDGEAGMTKLADVEAAADPSFDFESVWRAVDADDLLTIIYTSGTTGPPKGAQWSHRTAMAQLRALDAALPMPTDGIISFLPMAHAGGRITAHYMALVNGAAITTCADMKDLVQHLAEVHPDAFFSVPRFWEKFQVAIEAMVAGITDDRHRAATQHAIEVGLRKVKADDAGETALNESDAAQLADEYAQALKLLRPIIARLGLDNIKAAFVGGAPSAPELAQFFRAVGVPLLEAYGLTEGSLAVFNRVVEYKAGTAGKPLPGVEVALAPDGEILLRSEMNMVGYRKDPEQTATAIDSEGWLHTGDVGMLDDQGFLAIVDRKKELIINSAGKNMSPVMIESAIKGESSLIGHVVAIGDRRRYVTALITLDPEAAATYTMEAGLDKASIAELVETKELRAVVQGAVDRGNQRLNRNEQIKKFALLPIVWVPDSEELTPTAKLKRKQISEKYAAEIDALYAD
ncbi:AMP-dependent synthetase/ligase [Mycobacterium syngnathidarum]